MYGGVVIILIATSESLYGTLLYPIGYAPSLLGRNRSISLDHYYAPIHLCIRGLDVATPW